MISRLRGTIATPQRIEFERARSLMLGLAEPLAAEFVPLDDAHDRIVAATLFADEDLVPYARSAMDGYALRSTDTKRAAFGCVRLPVGGTTYAGDAPQRLEPGGAIAVATGAPLPQGADAVVPFEDVRRIGAAIEIDAAIERGDHVFGSGDDAKCGDVLVRHGESVSPGRAALLAAAGHAFLRVHRRPRVTIVCTGDEVVPVDRRPVAGQIRNSNAAMLAGQLARDGALIVSSVQAPDAPEPLRAMLRRALADSDLVITTGGASVGERDLVKDAFAALGTRFAFGSVALRPAKPTAFGRCGDALVAVLPGNPAAAFVAYAVLVRGVIRRLAGRLDAYPAPIDARLNGSIHSKPERHFVIFGRVSHARSGFSVVALGNQCSSLVRTSADANALIIVPPGSLTYRSGDLVASEILDWSSVDFSR